MSPEQRLLRAAMLLKLIKELGGTLAIVSGEVRLLSGAGRPLVEQLNRYYRREAISCIAASAVLARMDHV